MTFFVFSIMIVLVAAAVILNGWVFYILWGWFAVPLFGLPVLSISQAIGVSLTIGLLTHQYYATPDGKNWERFSFVFSHPLGVLLVGWIVKQWAIP